MARKKKKLNFFSKNTSKKVASSRTPLALPLDGMRIDGIIARERLTDANLLAEPILGIEERERRSLLEDKFDTRKRTFLKTAGFAGIGLAASTLLPKKAEAYVVGSTPTSNVVGIKDSTNTVINPATEETVSSILKTSDLTFDAGSLQVKVTSMPDSGGTSAFSDADDIPRSGLVSAERHVQVDVLSSTLPTAASTESTLQTISFGGVKYALRMVTVGDYDYLGEAAIGSATSSAVWRVKRIDYSTGVTIMWAGTGTFDQIWDNYASLTYT